MTGAVVGVLVGSCVFVTPGVGVGVAAPCELPGVGVGSPVNVGSGEPVTVGVGDADSGVGDIVTTGVGVSVGVGVSDGLKSVEPPARAG